MINLRFFVLSFFILGLAIQTSARDLKQQLGFFAYNPESRGGSIFVKVSQSRFQEIKLLGARVSDSIRVLNEDGQIHLYGAPIADEQGKEEHPLIGSISSDQQWKTAIIALSFDADEERPQVTGTSFSLNKKEFPLRTLKILNRIAAPVRGTIGNQSINLPPNQELNFAFDPDEQESLNVSFHYQKNAPKDQWNRILSTRWPNQVPETRLLLFFEQNPQTHRVSTKTISLRE